MALNMRTLTQALAKTAAAIEKTVQTTVQEVSGPKPLQDYDLLEQIGSGGPGLSWKLYSARPRGATASQYPVVCVWVIDKRALSEARARIGLPKATEEAFLDIIRADASHLVRLRHPGVVHVLQPLDENKNAMAMVTEPLFASVANTLGELDNIARLPKELKGLEMGLLEVKHGLLQIAESLVFLHNNARLVHRAISPETIFITASGAWKLGGFGFAISADHASGDSTCVPPFHYSEFDVDDSLLPLQPSLNYTAPELVRAKASNSTCTSDIFSFACLVYHVLAHKPLLDCHNNVKMYINKLTYMSSEVFSGIPSELISDLRRMLSFDEASRPTAMDFTGFLFFRNDTKLRALRFLDHLLERDNLQKSEFLKALAEMWKDFDARVLRYKVLPPLCAELRNMVMQPMILPMVFTIAESQDKSDFEHSTLPALVPVLSSASGEALLLLMKYADLLLNKSSHEHVVSYLLPLLVRAYDDSDARIQEEVLRQSASLAKQLDVQLVKQLLLPRVHRLALRTTVAAVRVNALLCLSDFVPLLDRLSIMEIMQTLHRCTAVDHSAPTLMCTLSVANSLLKQYGVEFTAEHVLPLLCPLLIAQQLNVEQFSKFMNFIQDILRKIEEKRGIMLTYSEASERKLNLSRVNGVLSYPVQSNNNSGSSVMTIPTWDEDWISPSGVVSTTSTLEPSGSPVLKDPLSLLSPIGSVNTETSLSALSTSHAPLSCAAVDTHWPPVSHSVSQLEENQKQIQNSGPDRNYFDDLNPLVKRTTLRNISTGLISGRNGDAVLSNADMQRDFGSVCQSGTAFFGIGSAALSKPENLVSGSNDQSGFGLSKSGLHLMSLNTRFGAGDSSGFAGLNTDRKVQESGSAFTSMKGEQMMPRLAPPPVTAIGRGRARPLILRSSQEKPQSDQSLILDLL